MEQRKKVATSSPPQRPPAPSRAGLPMAKRVSLIFMLVFASDPHCPAVGRRRTEDLPAKQAHGLGDFIGQGFPWTGKDPSGSWELLPKRFRCRDAFPGRSTDSPLPWRVFRVPGRRWHNLCAPPNVHAHPKGGWVRLAKPFEVGCPAAHGRTNRSDSLHSKPGAGANDPATRRRAGLALAEDPHSSATAAVRADHAAHPDRLAADDPATLADEVGRRPRTEPAPVADAIGRSLRRDPIGTNAPAVTGRC